MPYLLDVASSTPSRPLQADAPQPTTSAAASASTLSLSERWSDLPPREGSITPSIGRHRANDFSARRKPTSSEGVAKRIHACLQSTPSTRSAESYADARSRLRNYLNAVGTLTLKGEQQIAASKGHDFSPVSAPALILWTEKSNHLSLDEFAKRFNLYRQTLTNYAKADHTLTDKGDALLRVDQGHEFVLTTQAHIEQFQKLCSLPNTKPSMIDYCREMNLDVRKFGRMMQTDGTLTKAALARSAAQLIKTSSSQSTGGEDPVSGAGVSSAAE